MTDAASQWSRLRLKPDPTVNDYDWRANVTTPNRVTAVVGGTASAGAYVLHIDGFVQTPAGYQIPVNADVTFTRVAETSAQVAAGLEAAFDATAVSPSNAVGLAQLGFVCDVSSATLTLLFPPGFVGTISRTVPGAATMTFPLGSVLPICAGAPHFARGGEASLNGVVVMWQCLDSAGLPIAPGTATADLQLIELAEVFEVDSANTRTYRYAVAGTAAIVGTSPNTPYELPVRGAKYWTVGFTNDANLPGGTTQVEILWRDSAT